MSKKSESMDENPISALQSKLKENILFSHYNDEVLANILKIIQGSEYLNEDLNRLFEENVYYFKGLTFLALEDYVTALEIFHERNFDGKLARKAEYYRGICLMKKNDFVHALYYLEKFKEYDDTSDDEKSKADYNIGVSYYIGKNYENAIKSLQLSSEGGDDLLKQRSLFALGLCYYSLGKYEKAKEMFILGEKGPEEKIRNLSHTYVEICNSKLI